MGYAVRTLLDAAQDPDARRSLSDRIRTQRDWVRNAEASPSGQERDARLGDLLDAPRRLGAVLLFDQQGRLVASVQNGAVAAASRLSEPDLASLVSALHDPPPREA